MLLLLLHMDVHACMCSSYECISLLCWSSLTYICPVCRSLKNMSPLEIFCSGPLDLDSPNPPPAFPPPPPPAPRLNSFLSESSTLLLVLQQLCLQPSPLVLSNYSAAHFPACAVPSTSSLVSLSNASLVSQPPENRITQLKHWGDNPIRPVLFS